ncbi:MAG: FAD-dependent oxidoreductase [Eggerthellaceae bacterium]|nr:FAD-dependent oxidoreductase [Eggerthellaceae bacterium]
MDTRETMRAFVGNGFSRRNFVKLAAGTALLAALGPITGCAPKTVSAQEASASANRTVSCDVLVVGGGGAGVTAAALAAQNGADTVLIEKMGWLAGSSSLAIGTLYGAGTKMQQEQGIDDGWEGLYEYFLTRGGDKQDDEMQRFCAQHFGETIDWLREDLAVPFKDTLSLKGTDTVPRAHNLKPDATVALNAVYAMALQNGVRFDFEMPAESLIVENGEVKGVLARHSAEDVVEYRAAKTIIATGGFCRNSQMIDEYMPDYSGVYTEVGVGCTGEGLQMGLDIGADYIGHGGTNGILACAVSAGQSKLIDKKAMWVNAEGVRFNNEAGQTHDIYYQVAHFPGQSFYAVYDKAMVEALNADLKASYDLGLEMGIFAEAETVEEAGNALGINGAALQQQLDEYNAMVAAGEDTQFGKKAENLQPIDQGPFSVLTMGVCTHGSFGGYKVNTQFQVLDTAGQPIPNLYSAGEVCCGSFIYDDYPAGGCGLNFSYTSGRYAGINAANAVRA